VTLFGSSRLLSAVEPDDAAAVCGCLDHSPNKESPIENQQLTFMLNSYVAGSQKLAAISWVLRLDPSVRVAGVRLGSVGRDLDAFLPDFDVDCFVC
jgi:hypothetical protein